MAETTTVINTAYHECQTDLRIKHPTQLADDLGPDGACAIITDTDTGRVVATVSANPYTLYAKDREWTGFNDGGYQSGSHFMLFAVAVVADPRYRKMGLVGRCITELEKWLSQRKEVVAVWVKCVEHVNGVYWRKRGFVEVYREERPPGSYGSWGPGGGVWELGTLVRVVRRLDE